MTKTRLTGLTLTLIWSWSCAATTRPVEPFAMGRAASYAAMTQSLAEPGPVTLEVVRSADWQVPLSGLLNLDHPASVEAGLEDRDEPIQVYMYVLRHPTAGTYLIDSGVDGAGLFENVSWLLAQVMKPETMVVHHDTGAWLAAHGPVTGVILTHLHLDHVMGVPDVPANTPVYVGPGESRARDFMHAFTRGTIDAFLGERTLRELQVPQDPDGQLPGVLDLFGDGSVWVLSVPGHTPGSLAFVVRTPQGPRLLTADTCHTRFGWEHGVEPGSFTEDRAGNVATLSALRRLVAAHPMPVHVGHQPPVDGTGGAGQ